MEKLKRKIKSFRSEAMGIVSVPAEERAIVQVRQLAARGRELEKEITALADAAISGVRRAAILQADGGDESLAQLVALRACHHEIEGPCAHVSGMDAWLAGLPSMAATLFERAALDSETTTATDSLELLVRIHEERDEQAELLSARAAILALPGPAQDLDAAEALYGDALEITPDCVQASFGIAWIFERRGEIDIAMDLYLSVLANHPNGANLYLQRAYDRLRARVGELDSAEPLMALARNVVDQAPAHEADRAGILFAVLAHPSVSDEQARLLGRELVARIREYATPEDLYKDHEGRVLLKHRGDRLEAQVSLGLGRGLDGAEAVVADQRLQKVVDVPPAETSRVFYDLWHRHEQQLMRGQVEFASREEHLADYVRTLDRQVWWIGEAVRHGDVMEASTPIDLCELTGLLYQLYTSCSDEPATPEALAGMVSSVEVEERILPILAALQIRIRALHLTWEAMTDLQRLDAVIRSVSEADEISDFARDELITRVNQRLLSCGSLPAQLNAMVALTELYITQRRFDQALTQAEAAVELFPESPEANYWLGVSQQRSGKRLAGLDTLKFAAEKLGQASAYAAIAEDCAREEEPDFSARYYIMAVEQLIRHPEKLAGWEFDLASDWLRAAVAENAAVELFPVLVDKKVPRRERKERIREIEAKNKQLEEEKAARSSQMRELSKRISRTKMIVMRGVI